MVRKFESCSKNSTQTHIRVKHQKIYDREKRVLATKEQLLISNNTGKEDNGKKSSKRGATFGSMVSGASEKKVFPTDKDGDNTTRLWTPMKTQLYQSLQQGDRVQQTPEVTVG